MLRIEAFNLEQQILLVSGISTLAFWIVESTIEHVLNLPIQLNDTFVADVTRCYETIPLEGPEGLISVIDTFINTAFCMAKKTGYAGLFATPETTYQKARIQWKSSMSTSKGSFEITSQRLRACNRWLASNALVTLGGKVWRQTKGIPMGYSCSPIWCNLYLHFFEIQFIRRVARLGR